MTSVKLKKQEIGNEKNNELSKISITKSAPEIDHDIAQWADEYFLKSKRIIQTYGDKQVTYAIFMRRPVLFAPRLAVEWLNQIAQERDTKFKIDLMFEEGDWVGAGEPLMYVTGSFFHLVDLETELLMKIGALCLTAYNAATMAIDLPHISFIAMDARHCAGRDMANYVAYAVSVGSKRAQKMANAKGFIGNATRATSHYFGNDHALGTMPHALIGYAGSTLNAATLYHETFPDQDLIVLVDYFAKEVTDALSVCNAFEDLAKKGKLAFRLDIPGGRYIEGLDMAKSYDVLERHAPQSIRGYRTEDQLKHLVGTGVSAAAIHYFREKLDEKGFYKVRIVASSGFSTAKCKMMAEAKAPIDVIGTGSYLPENWQETYATADIISYDGQKMVKVGREFLFKKSS